MDVYRRLHNLQVPHDCKSNILLTEIYEQGQPALHHSGNIRSLLQREPLTFYPRTAICQIFNDNNGRAIREVLSCSCGRCKVYTSRHQRLYKDVHAAIQNPSKPKLILLAILIFLGTPYLIWELALYESPHDDALDMNSDKISDQTWLEIISEQGNHRYLSEQAQREKHDWFDNFSLVVGLFAPHTFYIGNKDLWERQIEDHRRLPFLDDEAHGQGAFGKVRKFNIHPDYIEDKTEEGLYADGPRAGQKHMFARKMLKKTSDRLAWDMEKRALRAITAQHHPNIVELLFVFQWKQKINFVFPFIERNLDQVFQQEWDNDLTSSPQSLRDRWMWQQIIGVAQGLMTIHDPASSSDKTKKKGSRPVIGFHFDLKPSNILVTEDRIMKISDFGQSLIKNVEPDDSSYGFRRGGSPTYAAPEAQPNLTVSEPDISSNAVAYRAYDIWSLGCIMIEVLTFLLYNGFQALTELREQIREEDGGPAFHTRGFGLDPRMKIAVKEHVVGFEASDVLISNERPYMHKIASVLQHMLKIDHGARPTSAQLVSFLQKTFEEVEENELNGKHNSKTKFSSSKYNELSRPSFDRVTSFNTMSGVQIRRSEVRTDRCILRLFISRSRDFCGLQIATAVDSEELELPARSAQAVYAPVNMHNPTRDVHICRVTPPNEKDVVLLFESASDLQEFQDVLLQTYVVGISDRYRSSLAPRRLFLRSITLEWNQSRKETIDNDHIELQVWRGWEPSILPPTAPKSTTLKAQTGDRNLFIFMCQRKRCISFPYWTDKKLEFRPDPPRVVILPESGHGFRDVKIADTDRDATTDFPTLPLTAKMANSDEKCRSTTLTFKDKRDLQTFAALWKSQD